MWGLALVTALPLFVLWILRWISLYLVTHTVWFCSNSSEALGEAKTIRSSGFFFSFIRETNVNSTNREMGRPAAPHLGCRGGHAPGWLLGEGLRRLGGRAAPMSPSCSASSSSTGSRSRWAAPGEALAPAGGWERSGRATAAALGERLCPARQGEAQPPRPR